MELVNKLYKYKELENVNEGLFCRAVNDLVLMLAPFTPHICEEMWEALGHSTSLAYEKWPELNEEALVQDNVEIIVQINGKLRHKLSVNSNLDKEQLEEAVLADEKVAELLEGKNVVKTIVVPGRLVNFVAK